MLKYLKREDILTRNKNSEYDPVCTYFIQSNNVDQPLISKRIQSGPTIATTFKFRISKFKSFRANFIFPPYSISSLACVQNLITLSMAIFQSETKIDRPSCSLYQPLNRVRNRKGRPEGRRLAHARTHPGLISVLL